jgi:hypothetical protein
VILENAHLLVEMDPRTGAICRLVDRRTGVELIQDSRLSEPFRLLVPTADTQANYVYGCEQQAPVIEAHDDRAILRWNGPLHAVEGVVDVDVTLEAQLDGEALRFRLTLTNRSDLAVAEICGPILGGIHGFGSREETQALIPAEGPWSDPYQSRHIFRTFHGRCPPGGYNAFGDVNFGSPSPEYLFRYPGEMSMPWMDIYNEGLARGACFWCLDDSARFRVLRLALHPGIGHMRDDSWPRPDELAADTPAGLTATWICFPYVVGGETFTAPEIVVAFHDGDWHQASARYRAAFDARSLTITKRRNWLERTSAYQFTMMLLPEGNVLFRYGDLGEMAREAKRYGIEALQLGGWDRGGHDNNYPYYEPDPRLGTWDELAAGIHDCHEEGVRVTFFVNLQPVDCTTEWYERELHQYRSTDPWGTSARVGWGMGTIGARLGMTQRPLVYASPGFPEFRRILVDQFRRLAEIGADGIHIDKLAWFDSGLEFNPGLDARPDLATWEGILAFMREAEDECRTVNSDFAFSWEGSWDRLLEYSGAAWAWHSPQANDHVAAFKYTFPEWMPALAVAQPFEYNVVNNAVRFGYQILVAPANFLSTMAYPPMHALADYIKDIQVLRANLHDTIVLGTFTDTLDAEVVGEEGVLYNTHRNPSTGKCACVIVNQSAKPRQARLQSLGRSASAAHVYRPSDKPERIPVPTNIVIPGERLVAILEE